MGSIFADKFLWSTVLSPALLIRDRMDVYFVWNVERW